MTPDEARKALTRAITDSLPSIDDEGNLAADVGEGLVEIYWPVIEAAIRANEPLDVLNAAAYMLGLVDSFYGTDHEPDPENANDEATYDAEALFRKHRQVIENAIAALGELQP